MAFVVTNLFATPLAIGYQITWDGAGSNSITISNPTLQSATVEGPLQELLQQTGTDPVLETRFGGQEADILARPNGGGLNVVAANVSVFGDGSQLPEIAVAFAGAGAARLALTIRRVHSIVR